MTEILSHTLEYFQKTNDKFQKSRVLFSCPICSNLSCRFIPNTFRMTCFKCGKIIGDLGDIISEQLNIAKDEALLKVKTTLSLDVVLHSEESYWLDFYEKASFDIVPLARNQKIPIEKDWLNKPHKTQKEWKEFLAGGLNIGVKTGFRSQVTIIDIDTEVIPKIVEENKGNTLIQRTKQGWHLFYQYDKDITTTRYDELKIDVLNDGKQCILFPSKVDNYQRLFINKVPIAQIPDKLKEFFITQQRGGYVSKMSKEEDEDIGSLPTEKDLEELGFNVFEEGNRNIGMMSLGGILRKELPLEQCRFVLNVLNKHFCNPTLSPKEFNNIINSINKYIQYDEQELATKVLKYMNIVEEANARDVREALGYAKERIDNVLSYLTKEGFLFKKRRMFHIMKKINWKDTFVSDSKVIDFKVPYLYDTSVFRNGDMVIIGARTKTGKSHIAINIVKRLVEQGVKPYYISLESGNRFVSIAEALNLKEGDFNWAVHFSPESIEIEENAVTILDWLLPNDYAETDKLYKHFAEQLVKHGGFLIIFVQLKESGKFFAENMISMFPSVVCRYVYDDETDGTDGKFILDYIREPIMHKKTATVPCKYIWNEKRLVRLDELNIVEDKKEEENHVG